MSDFREKNVCKVITIFEKSTLDIKEAAIVL